GDPDSGPQPPACNSHAAAPAQPAPQRTARLLPGRLAAFGGRPRPARRPGGALSGTRPPARTPAVGEQIGSQPGPSRPPAQPGCQGGPDSSLAADTAARAELDQAGLRLRRRGQLPGPHPAPGTAGDSS